MTLCTTKIFDKIKMDLKVKTGEKMTTKVGINGFVASGRLTLRTINQYHKGNLEIVAVNDLTGQQNQRSSFKMGQHLPSIKAP